MSEHLDTEAQAAIAEARSAAAEYANAKGYYANTSALEHLRSLGPSAIPALLAENERLQRERSEWCDQADRRLTDYMTQQRDLLAENAALREALTLTPEKVEAAAKAGHEAWDDIGWNELTENWQNDWSAMIHAALLAAGMEEATP